LPACFSAYKIQELPVTQLARQVDLFHLVTTENQRPKTLSLPHGLAPPIKPTTHFSQAAILWTWGSAQQSVINLSFPHETWSLFGGSLQFYITTCFHCRFLDRSFWRLFLQSLEFVLTIRLNIWHVMQGVSSQKFPINDLIKSHIKVDLKNHSWYEMQFLYNLSNSSCNYFYINFYRGSFYFVIFW
jgi:hypothetical protein